MYPESSDLHFNRSDRRRHEVECHECSEVTVFQLYALRHKELLDVHCCCEHVVWHMAACHNVSTARCDRNCCLWVKRNNDGGNIRSNYWYRHSRSLPASSRTISDPYVGAFPVQCRLWRASVICLPHTFASFKVLYFWWKQVFCHHILIVYLCAI